MMKRLYKMKTWLLFAAIFAMIGGPGILRLTASRATNARATSRPSNHQDAGVNKAAASTDKPLDRNQLSYAVSASMPPSTSRSQRG